MLWFLAHIYFKIKNFKASWGGDASFSDKLNNPTIPSCSYPVPISSLPVRDRNCCDSGFTQNSTLDCCLFALPKQAPCKTNKICSGLTLFAELVSLKCAPDYRNTWNGSKVMRREHFLSWKQAFFQGTSLPLAITSSSQSAEQGDPFHNQ